MQQLLSGVGASIGATVAASFLGLSGRLSGLVGATPTAQRPVVNITANAAAIGVGASTTLSWSSINATACVASGAWSGARNATGTATVRPSGVGNFRYALDCTGPGGASSVSTTITVSLAVLRAPTVTLVAAPASVTVGGSSSLTWSSTNALSCMASGAWIGARGLRGSQTIRFNAAGTKTFTLTCSGLGGRGSAAATVAGNPPVITGTIRGRVVNTVNGAPVQNALVRSSSALIRTDANGEFVLPRVPVSLRALLRVEAAGFETSFRIASVFENQETMASVLAVPIGASATIDPGAGGTVQIPRSEASVFFPAGAIESTEPVRVTITDLNPGSSVGNMPGDYTTAGDGQIESFGALTVNLRNAAGAAVPLRAGATATLRIPPSGAYEVPRYVPLFYFDETTGRWVQEGEANLTYSSFGRPYYQGAVSHFTTWNADRLYPSVTITGCVQDRGEPVGGVLITSVGKSYTGTSTARTGVDGRFTIAVRPQSTQTLSGMLGRLVTSSREVPTGDVPVDITTSCLQIARDATPFSVRLSWGQLPDDLDARITLPQGGEVSYQNRGNLQAEPFVELDTDDTLSFGPEVTTVLRPRVGIYRYYINNFSRSSSPGITTSPARVELMANGMLQVFTPPAGETVDTYNWTVFDISIAANCQATVTRPTAPWTPQLPVLPEVPNSSAAFCGP